MDFKKNVRAILANKNVTVSSKLNHIKQSVNSSDYKEALKMHPSLMMHLMQRASFHSLDQISFRDSFQFTGDFRKEFRWATAIVERNLLLVNEFLLSKDKFDFAFVLQNYDDAKNILNKIESEFGISLWTIEADLKLTEYTVGTEKNWEKLSYYLDNIKNPFYEFIISAYSKRIELGLPHDGYQNQFQNEIDNVNAFEFIKDFLVFKCFSVTNYDYEYKNLESVIYFSNIFNPVDQYLILIDVIIYVTSLSSEFDKVILPFVKKAQNIVSNDFRLKNIYNVINLSDDLILSPNQLNIIDCLDYYYNGLFEIALIQSKNLLLSYPLEFELYEIYCKSLINLRRNFEPTAISSFLDNVLITVYKTLSFEKKYLNDRKNLLKLSLLLMDLNLGKQIYALLSETEVMEERTFSTSVLSSTFNTPKNLLLKNRQLSIRRNFANLLSSSQSFKMFSFKAGDDIYVDEISSTSELQMISLKSIHLVNSGNYSQAIELLLSTNKLDTDRYYYERKVSLLLTSYLKSNRIQEALILFGKIYFDETFVTGKLDFAEILNQVKISGYEKYAEHIELPIIYSLIIKGYDIFEVTDDFFIAQDIDSIREINIEDFIKHFSLDKTVYFLNKVLTINTLKFSTDYGSINVVEEERIFILNLLVSIDPTNKLEYEKEINEIYRINSVRKVLKEVDEGRLYIDVKNLKDLQVKSFTDIFSRFRDIALSSSNKHLIGFNAANVRNWDIEKQDKTDIREEYNSADYIAFKNIYLVSRDNFLFSKEYGLDSCLSTRIRHGALKNHIRSVFEKLDLVTSKYNDKYIDNKVWESQLRYNPVLNSIVQEKLKSFSKEIDDYTGYIVNSLIQIQTEKMNEKPDGLFKYFTNDEILFDFYNRNKYLLTSIESTIERLLSSLVNYTLTDVLRTIVDALTVTIPRHYKAIIDRVISDLRDLDGINSCDIIPNLTKSSTDIQLESEYLSEWFYLNTTSSASLLPLDIILDASIELTNKINPTFNLSPNIDIKTQVFGYSNLIFVFNIMLNNVIHHSGLYIDDIQLKIDVGLHNGENHVYVRFTHKLNTDCDYISNKSRLELVKQNWNDHSNIDRSNKEGESGYDKIKRILIYEALAKTELFDFEIEGDQIAISLFLPYSINKE